MNTSFWFIWICFLYGGNDAQPECSDVYTQTGSQTVLPFRGTAPTTGPFLYKVVFTGMADTLLAEWGGINGAVTLNITLYGGSSLGPDADIENDIIDIKLSAVTSTSGGQYELRSTLTTPVIVMQCIRLHILDAQRVTIQINNAEIVQYSTATITATVYVSTQVSLHRIVWLENGNVKSVIMLPSCEPFLDVDRSQYDFTCDIIHNRFTWTIKNVTQTNHGDVCSCQVLTDDSTIEDSGILISNYLPMLVVVPITTVNMTNYISRHTVTEKGTIQLHCVTSGGRPGATVRWYRTVNDGSTCDTSNEITVAISVTISTVGALNITSSTLQYTAHRNDNGVGICCSASNMRDQELTSQVTRLNVQYPPHDRPVITGSMSNSDFYMIENTLANLTCIVIGGNPLANLTWSCFGKTGSSQNIADQTVSRTVIWTASRGDERRCRCIATHVAGQPQDVAVNVKVLYPPSTPTLTVQSKQVQVVHLTEGDLLTISCNSSSVPPPDTYTWILPDGTTRSGQLLHVDSVQYHYNLVYTCIAQNHMIPSQGSTVFGRSGAPLSVILLYSPRPAYINQCSEDYVATAGQRTVLSITLAANPLPFVHVWTKCKRGVCSHVRNDTNKVISTFGLTSNLTILSMKQEDFGQYVFTATNGIGLPYNFTFFLRETVAVDQHSEDSNAALISGVVGGVVAFAVIVVAVVVIIVCLVRRKSLGGHKTTSYKNSKQHTHRDDVKKQTSTGQISAERNNEAGISTAEPTPQREYIDLAQYGNVQNPYEELGSAVDSQTRKEKTYTNVIS